ncbi:hypothetical protein OG562_13565 [Streptomyces sp. NBC_01275]|uniref:hypothetical protein n=1 Tax=Streptomyces sp. NBC_01275 TaxID=2903807 RepID=UPI002254820B|nr:hypothetical protein [Streptomyces sp. NBC_01275]MCX4761982.1 hypothetical protein [Streptomyces sp. NBC_01275]
MLQDAIRQLPPALGTDLEQVLLHTLKARRLHDKRDAKILVVSAALIPLAFWAASQGMFAGTVVIVVTLISSCLPIVFRDLREVRNVLVEMSKPDGGWKLKQGPDFKRVKGRLDLISSTQFGAASSPFCNVSIHDGFEPFGEYGSKVSGWSLVVPLRPQSQMSLAVPANPFVPVNPFQEFTPWELSCHLKGSLKDLSGRSAEDVGSDRDSHGGGDGAVSAWGAGETVLVEDRVFVNGNLARGVGQLWDHRSGDRSTGPASSGCNHPVQHWSDLQGVADRPGPAARHYLGVYVSSWGGELVTSTFLHFAVEHKTLYIDCQRVVMPPVAERYRVLDRMGRRPSSDARLWGITLLKTPLRIVLAPALIVGRRVSDLAHRLDRKRLERQAESGSGVDFSVGLNIRKWIGEGVYRSHFQKIDSDRHLKAIERHVLAEIVEFLDDKGMDVSDFKSQQTVILNQGIIHTGGTSNADNVVIDGRSQFYGFASPSKEK